MATAEKLAVGRDALRGIGDSLYTPFAVPTATTSTGMRTARWCVTASVTSAAKCCGAPAVSRSSGR